MQNRLQALLLTALMVWTLAAPAMGANPFYDVPEDHWAYDSVEYLAEAGLVEGYPDGSFGGSRNFTRYEMALVFARIVARFEQYVDQRIDQGIDSRLEELTEQVATAMKEASGALEAASGASGDLSAVEAARQAQLVAEQAMEVALGTLDAIDARGWDDRMDGADAQASAAAAKAQEALAAAERAMISANEAMDVALGTLDVMDGRNYDDRIDAASAQADQALALAQKAMESAEEALITATGAMDVAVGILDAIDARGWDAQLEEALTKAEEALALARSIAVVDGAVGTTPSSAPSFTNEARAAIEEIAAAVVMDKLAAIEANADQIAGQVGAIRTDANAARALIESEAARLEKAIKDLTNEFGAELEILGVRVARLETKFTSLETQVASLDDEVKSIRADLDRYNLSGFNETKIVYGSPEGDKVPNNPRDKDAGEWTVPETGVVNRLQLRFDGKPNSEVDLVGLVDLTYDARPSGDLLKDSEIYVEATSERPVRVIRLGYLDQNRVAKGFSSEMVNAKDFGKVVGAFTNIVSATTDNNLFVGSVVADNNVAAGFSSSIQLGPDMDVQLGAVKLFDDANPRTGISLGTTGNMEDLKYSVAYISDVEKDATVHDVSVELPIESALVRATSQKIDAVWSTGDRLPFAAEVKLQDANKADKVVDINNDVFADQSLSKVRVDLPVASFQAFAQAGSYASSITGNVSDSFSQYGVYDLDLFGFNTEVTRSNFEGNTGKNLYDTRASFATRLEDIDLNLDIHKATGAQVADRDVRADLTPYEEQSHFMVSLAKPVHIFVPWTGTMKFATSFTADEPMHSEYKLAMQGYELMPDVTIGAEIGAENNVITDGKWRMNHNWTGENQTTRALDATWSVADPVNVTAAYKVVDNDTQGLKITQDAGLEYLMSGAFGGDLKLGYGYRVVRVDGAVDGSPRSILSAEFTKTQGALTLSANAKRYIGGTEGEDGNDYDTIASLKMTYPVFEGADFTVDGKYVSSEGDKAGRDEYSASSVSAGLKFNF